MTGDVVAFPSGRSVEPAGPEAVAGIAEKLYRGLRRRGALPRSPKRLAVDLDALCGICDPTIVRLSILSAAGSITPETAARLALRHAREIGNGRFERPARIRGVPGVYDLHVAGTAPNSFAVRIASSEGEPWIGSAARHAYGRLLRVCPDGSAICLLFCRAQAGTTLVRVVTSPSWQGTLVGRSMTPGWRTIRHVLVVGGLPAEPVDDCDVTDAVANYLRSLPLKVLPNPHAPNSDAIRNPTAILVVRLLAIAMPGLVRPPHEGGRR